MREKPGSFEGAIRISLFGFGHKSRGTDGKPTVIMTLSREPKHSMPRGIRKRE
jgi:hypothetical protein